MKIMVELCAAWYAQRTGRGAKDALRPMQDTKVDGRDLHRRELFDPSFCICQLEEQIPTGVISAYSHTHPPGMRPNTDHVTLKPCHISLQHCKMRSTSLMNAADQCAVWPLLVNQFSSNFIQGLHDLHHGNKAAGLSCMEPEIMALLALVCSALDRHLQLLRVALAVATSPGICFC